MQPAEFSACDAIASLSASDLRARVFDFEREQAKRPQVELRVVHHYSPGLAAREVHIPAGTEVTGAIHKYHNMNTLSKGEMLVTTENGIEHVKAPFTVVSPPGTKRAALALTDCVWTTYLPTNETDPEKIAKYFTTNSEQEYLVFADTLSLEGK